MFAVLCALLFLCSTLDRIPLSKAGKRAVDLQSRRLNVIISCCLGELSESAVSSNAGAGQVTLDITELHSEIGRSHQVSLYLQFGFFLIK